MPNIHGELPPNSSEEDSIERRYRIRLARLAMEEALMIDIGYGELDAGDDPFTKIEHTPVYKEVVEHPGDWMSKPQHHVMFPKALHNAQNPSKEIRNNRWLIVPLDAEVHNELHRNVGMVPVMGWLMETRIQSNFYPHGGNYVKSVENLAHTVFEVTQQRNTPYLEKELGRLVVYSLELQLEYIEQGLITSSYNESITTV